LLFGNFPQLNFRLVDHSRLVHKFLILRRNRTGFVILLVRCRRPRQSDAEPGQKHRDQPHPTISIVHHGNSWVKPPPAAIAMPTQLPPHDRPQQSLIAPSISSISTGASFVRFSHPVPVTTTVSSHLTYNFSSGTTNSGSTANTN